MGVSLWSFPRSGDRSSSPTRSCANLGYLCRPQPILRRMIVVQKEDRPTIVGAQQVQLETPKSVERGPCCLILGSWSQNGRMVHICTVGRQCFMCSPDRCLSGEDDVGIDCTTPK